MTECPQPPWQYFNGCEYSIHGPADGDKWITVAYTASVKDLDLSNT